MRMWCSYTEVYKKTKWEKSKGLYLYIYSSYDPFGCRMGLKEMWISCVLSVFNESVAEADGNGIIFWIFRYIYGLFDCLVIDW